MGFGGVRDSGLKSTLPGVVGVLSQESYMGSTGFACGCFRAFLDFAVIYRLLASGFRFLGFGVQGLGLLIKGSGSG